MNYSIRKLYRCFQAVSLDVVLGSAILNLAIAKCYQVELPVTAVLSLMVAVWMIYTFDHLCDANNIITDASTFRHRFHQKHHRNITVIFIVVAIPGIALVYSLPPLLLYYGLLCLAAVGVYFLLLKFRFLFNKELIIALCYTAGVFLAPFVLSSNHLTIFQWMLIPQTFLLALANLMLFAYYDYKSDKQDGQYSLAIHLGPARVKILIITILAAGIALNLISLQAKLAVTFYLQILILIMNLMLLFILLLPETFRKNDMYRVIGDGIFFIPSILLLYAS